MKIKTGSISKVNNTVSAIYHSIRDTIFKGTITCCGNERIQNTETSQMI